MMVMVMMASYGDDGRKIEKQVLQAAPNMQSLLFEFVHKTNGFRFNPGKTQEGILEFMVHSQEALGQCG